MNDVLPNKVSPVCQRCRKRSVDEVRVSRVEGGERVEESYCSEQCFRESVLEWARPEMERRVRKEEAELHKLVCPACVRRIRKRSGG
jgi:hypothetical protein